MKNVIKYIVILFLIGIIASSKPVYGQSATGQLETLSGQKINSSSSSAASSAADLNNAVAGALMGGILNSLFRKSPTPSQAEIEAKQKADIEARQRAAELAAELAAENERKAQEKHENMMESYNVLDNGIKDLTYKGLIDEKPKWDQSEFVLSEQALLDTNTQTWIANKREQFKIRLERTNYLCKKYYEDLVRQDSLIKINQASKIMSVPPIKVSEFQPGDVILFGDGSYIQAKADAILNENDANYTHTVTCIKVVNGKRFYLDNQGGEGPRIITQEQFVGRYKDRTSSVAQMRGKGDAWGVAQPLNETEANKLWDKAMELNNNNRDNVKYDLDNKKVNNNLSGTNYGIYGDGNMVCSEASWKLINATGRYQIPGLKDDNLISKVGIKFSPASFYSADQYFLITPLQR